MFWGRFEDKNTYGWKTFLLDKRWLMTSTRTTKSSCSCSRPEQAALASTCLRQTQLFCTTLISIPITINRPRTDAIGLARPGKFFKVMEDIYGNCYDRYIRELLWLGICKNFHGYVRYIYCIWEFLWFCKIYTVYIWELL